MRKINGVPVEAQTDLSSLTGGEVLKWDATNTLMAWQDQDSTGYVPIVWTGDRGVFGGHLGGGISNTIDYITISATGNAIDFGDLTNSRHQLTGCSSGTRGVFLGGEGPLNTIDYITIASTGNADDFGDLVVAANGPTACSSTLRGVIFGGSGPSGTIAAVDYITIASTGNASNYGTMPYVSYYSGSISNGVRAHIIGGHGASYLDDLTYFTIDSTSSFTDFGNLATAAFNHKCAGSTDRGLFSTGSAILYITFSSLGVGSSFGNLGSNITSYCGATSNLTRGVWAGGGTNNTIEYVTIASTGDATDFGDLTVGRQGIAGVSGD